MLSLGWGMVWTIVNLIILYFLLRKFLFTPVCNMMDERAAKIQADLDDAAKAKNDAEQLKNQHEMAVADAKNEAQEIIRTAEDNADKESARIIEEAHCESARIIDEAQKAAENERRKMLGDVRVEITDLAMLAAVQVMQKNIDSQTERRAAGDFLKELEAEDDYS